jgi:Fe-S-cluster containining protein
MRESSVVTRILNVVQSTSSTQRIEAGDGPLPMAAFSTEPCSRCASRCCERQVVLSTSEAMRIGFALGLRLRSFVETMPWTRGVGLVISWPFKLDDGGRTVLRFKRSEHGCTHLVRPGTATSRCGIYGVRPSLCRLYPFIVDDDGERLAIGGQEICPEQWLQTEATVAGVADAVDQLRIDREHDRQIVLAWNKGRRARNFDGLLTFLENEAATALGYEPQRLASFGG